MHRNPWKTAIGAIVGVFILLGVIGALLPAPKTTPTASGSAVAALSSASPVPTAALTPPAPIPTSAAPVALVPSSSAPTPAATQQHTAVPSQPAQAQVTPQHAVTHAPAPANAPPTQSGPNVVHPGAFCAPEGATGVTDRGTAMVCGTTAASPTRARWHAA